MVVFSPEGRLYSAHCGLMEYVVDVGTGKTVWAPENREVESYVEFIGPDLMRCSIRSDGQSNVLCFETKIDGAHVSVR
jgi:hypothetical protein